MWVEWFLIAILGWCVFVPGSPPSGNARIALMVVFIILMVIWAVLGAGTMSGGEHHWFK